MKILFHEVQHFSPKIKYNILAQNWREKKCQNPFQAIIRLKKKVAWTTKPLV